MKVRGPAEPIYFNVISAAIIAAANVKRLMQITNDMDYKP